VRFCRYALGDGSIQHGIVEGQAVVQVEGDIFGRYGATSQIHPVEEIVFLPPVNPTKIIALGTNFKRHAEEMDKPVPDEPKIFLKPPSALIGHKEAIVLPDVPGTVEHEAELALVVNQVARNIPEDRAQDFVLGYTCFNDVTARALQAKDGVYARAKGFDTFAPVGPWIETEAIWEDLVVEGWVNGTRRQRGELRDLVFGVPAVLAFVSRVMTLMPGDLVVLGTPSGVGPLQEGDLVQVVVEGVGTLENPVVEA
jgi:2-keto-4-pentenoate hydratase/2-oxohepta-3-ene-1,7-dioic acid hydratase in catechol pathway